MTDIGFVLFWWGATAAYLGTSIFPSFADKHSTALWVLVISFISGWLMMAVAALVFGYERSQAWLEMPAAPILGIAAFTFGIFFSGLKPAREEH